MKILNKLEKKTKDGMRGRKEPIGLYDLIGGSQNNELNSKIIENFLDQNILDLKTKKRVLAWKKELEFWEEYAKIYYNLEKANPYSRLSKTIENFVNPKQGDVCLDVGCGPAKMSQVIWKKSKKKVKKIIGIDTVLRPARETMKKMGYSIPLEIRYASIGQELPFTEGYFNVIVANLILPYVIDFEEKRGKEAFEAVLREMYRILKPGGHMVWSTPKKNVHFQWVFMASIPDMLNIYKYIVNKDITRILQGTKILKHALEIQQKGKNGIYTFLSKKELEDLLLKTGFVNLVWEKTFAGQVWVNRIYKPVTNETN